VVEEGAKDGEMIVYGPNVMKGYHKKPKETAEVITDDGGFRTGARGMFDGDGFLWITGRIKEQYKLSNGKYVFPAVIEEEIKLLPMVANATIYGEGKPFNVCLVVPDFEAARKWAKEKQVSDSPEEMIMNPEFTAMLEKEIITHLRKTFGGYEVPKKFSFLKDDFSVENGMLTQTMKLKRREVVKNYKNEIEAMYGQG
jgi:long-chain acyl-CoA synthetase